MNREIKFRAFWKDTLKPIPDFNEEYLIDACNDEIFIVNQYTGLKDKNRNPIYDGDILRSINHYEGKEPFYLYHIVKYDINYSGFMAIHKDNKENTTGNGNVQLWVYIKNISNFEIIGNIYENPNLLK